MTQSPTDDLDHLRKQVSGMVLAPEDAGFDDARAVWNAMIDQRPAAVVRVSDVADIAPTIAFSREHRLDLAVRGGGHHVAGNGCAGRVVSGPVWPGRPLAGAWAG
jgi:FAD/FMN-containing dehydrogenase